MAEVALSYELGEAGWASFSLKVGAKSIYVGTFGYCTDGLGDLVRAALEIATGSWRAEALFDGEPEAWRLRLQRDWSTPGVRTLMVGVDQLDDISLAAERPGAELFSVSCDADAFAQAVAEGAEAVWRDHGAEGYNRLWNGLNQGFPLRALTALKAALATEEAPWAQSEPSEGGFVFGIKKP
jgi:hypothetical protein